MIDLSMAYERARTASPLATAAVVVALSGCRWHFDDVPTGDADAELPCAPAVAIAEIDAGHDYVCATLADASIRCWGSNEVGQLGDGTLTSTIDAVSPMNLPDVAMLASGYQHACAVRAGEVLCWGRNEVGQLGLGDRVARRTPTRVNGLPGDMVGVAAGGLSTCAWAAGGELYCWGGTSATVVGASNIPRLVTGIPPVRRVAVSTASRRFSTDHGCAIATDNKLWCWGGNNFYQVGDGTMTEQQSPVPAAAGLTFEHITLGNSYTCGITTDGDAYCWGLNYDGQAGVPGAGMPVYVIMQPARVSLADVVELDASSESTCALTRIGDVYCWGDNDNRQLGRDGDDARSPERVPLPPAARLAVGTDSTCALGVDGVVRCWGSDRSGIVSGSVADATTTTLGDIRQIAAGGDTTCARTASGEVYCWGSGTLGQLGDGNLSPPTATPTLVPLPRAASYISVGHAHACAVLDDSTVRCWGFNEAGQVDGPGMLVRPPSLPPGLPPMTAITTGGGHTCAYSSPAPPWCWGNSDEGAIGAVAPTHTPPVQSQFSAMSLMDAGGNHTCGIGGGALYCAGRNNEDQIGSGGPDTYTPYNLPLASVTRVATGAAFTCAHTGGVPATTWCWGDHVSGQLGLGLGVTAALPSAQSPSGPIAALVAGRSHACTLEALTGGGGVVRCWGANADGQLGTGSLSTSHVPILAPELAGAVALAAGDRHTCALIVDGSVRCVGGNDLGQLGGGGAVPSAAPRQARITCP